MILKQVHWLQVKIQKAVLFLKNQTTRQFISLNQTRQIAFSWVLAQMTMPKKIVSKSNQMTPPSPRIVALFHIETSFIFTAVQIIRTKYSSLIVTIQKYVPVLSLILLVERVQVTTIIYFSVFQLKISDCVINQKALYLKNGGSGLRS